MASNEAIDRIEAALCGRYNVQTLQGLGSLSDALAAARAGNSAPLEAAIAEREMYHWTAEINAAVRELRAAPAPAVEAAPEPVAEPEAEAEEAPAEAEEPEHPHRRGRARSE